MATNSQVSTIRSMSSINPNYLLTLSNGDGVKIEVPIPKDFGVRSETEWGTIGKDLAPGSWGNFLNSIIDSLDFASKASGIQSSYKNAITQFPIWLSNSPISFDIPFEFRAMSNAQKEVVEPVKQLLALSCPREEGSFLHAPGPRLQINSATGALSFDPKFNLKLKFGNFMTIRNILITNVNPTFDSRFVASGAPISAKAEVSFRTLKAPTYQEILSWFDNGNSFDPLQDLINKHNSSETVKSAMKNLSSITKFF